MRGGITEHLTSPHLTAVSCPLCFCYIFDISVESQAWIVVSWILSKLYCFVDYHMSLASIISGYDLIITRSVDEPCKD